MTRDDIVAEVRSYINTPFVFRARLKGVGIDCVGLLTVILDYYEIGYKLPLKNNVAGLYELHPKKGVLIECLEGCLKRIKKPRTGCVACMWFRTVGHDAHLGWITGEGMIHTYTEIGKVVEHPVDSSWQARFMRFYDLPGVRDETIKESPFVANSIYSRNFPPRVMPDPVEPKTKKGGKWRR